MQSLRPASWLLLVLVACGDDDDDGSLLADAATAPADAALTPADAAPPSTDAALAANHVIPIYIIATDEPAADTAAHVATYEAMLVGIESWYADRMDGEYEHATFWHEPVHALPGHYTRAEWDDFSVNGFLYPDGHRTEAGGGCSMYYGTLHEMVEGGLLAAAGLPPPGSPGVLYYAIPGGGTNGSCGAGGYLGASELEILTSAAATCSAGRLVPPATDCQLVGAVAHELGHGFGLPHGSDRPACTDGPTLMDVWWEYDMVARLCVEDRVDLAASGYFRAP
jgi:hypothetical protein